MINKSVSTFLPFFYDYVFTILAQYSQYLLLVLKLHIFIAILSTVEC